MNGDAVTAKLMSTTDSGEWQRIGGFKLDFVTDHPQGLLRVGDRWFLSTVRIPEGEPGAPDLTVPGDGYLIEQMEITSAPSTSVLAHFAEPALPDVAELARANGTAHRRSLVVGVPDDLAPQILDEVDDVAARLDAACVLRGEEATRARLSEESSGVSILHLACHARFDPETPLAST